MKSTTRVALLAAVASALVWSAACVSTRTRDDDSERIVIAHGSDRLPNQTATDWVTYADHVVIVTPIKEAEIPPAAEEVAAGEGLILRRVTLRVDETLWTRPKPSAPAPQQFDWTAFGWKFEGHERTMMAGEDEPRIELGHHYIMAIAWQPALCTPGDSVAARWRGLGADSTIPYDNQVIGAGELEGRARTLAQSRTHAQSQGPNTSLEDQLAGRSAAALRATLSRMNPDQAQQYGPSPAATPCS